MKETRKLPFVDGDTKDYNEKQKKLAETFESIREFFYPECEENNETEDNKEQAENLVESQENKSKTEILLKAVSDAVKSGLFILFIFGMPLWLLLLTGWSDAGDYAKNVFLKLIAIIGGYLFFVAFGIRWAELSEKKAEKEEQEKPMLPCVLRWIATSSLKALLLCAVIFCVYFFSMNTSYYRYLPLSDKVSAVVETLEEECELLKEDFKNGAYEKTDTYEVELTQVSSMYVRYHKRYIYSLKNASGETAMFYDYGNLYTSICEGHEVGEKIPLPITIQIDLIKKKNGEQYYFYGDEKLQRME